MSETAPHPVPHNAPDVTALPIARTVLGAVQGYLLYWLFEAARNHSWPATEATLFAPLLLVTVLVPTVAIIAHGQMPVRHLAIWSALLGVVLSALGFHDIWRGVESPFYVNTANSTAHLPSAGVCLFSAVLVFIAHSLISAGEAEKRWVASYERYFDASWKLAIQLQFSTLFVGIFWGLLGAGAALFQLIGLDFLTRLLKESAFFIPATTLAFTAAIHLTDVRPAIVRGVRTLLLTLLSWLLPLLVLMVGGFLISIPFTGLAILWATHHAAALLLGVAATIVILVNAAFQQGRPATEVPPVLRHATRAACLFLAPLLILAAHALWLRIDQYGLTTDRVIAGAGLLVASCYAFGYGWAALGRGNWLGRVAPTNLWTSYVVLAVLVALFTPIADPARLAVDRQLARLIAGQAATEKFDFAYLRFETARYGREALGWLAKERIGPHGVEISEQASKALQWKNRGEQGRLPLARLSVADNLVVQTRGTRLADDFLADAWRGDLKAWTLPNCLTVAGAKCEAYVADFTGDGQADVLLLPTVGQGVLFARDEKNRWRVAARLNMPKGCPGDAAALAAGDYRLLAPAVLDLEIHGRRLRLLPESHEEEGCKAQ